MAGPPAASSCRPHIQPDDSTTPDRTCFRAHAKRRTSLDTMNITARTHRRCGQALLCETNLDEWFVGASRHWERERDRDRKTDRGRKKIGMNKKYVNDLLPLQSIGLCLALHLIAKWTSAQATSARCPLLDGIFLSLNTTRCAVIP